MLDRLELEFANRGNRPHIYLGPKLTMETCPGRLLAQEETCKQETRNMRTMGGTAHLRRCVSVSSRSPSGTEPLIHRSRREREGGRPQPSAPASGRRLQPEPIGSPELKLPGDPIGLSRTKSGGAMSGRRSSPPRRAGAYPPTLSRGPARHARSRAGWQRPAASRWPVPASGHRRPLACLVAPTRSQ